MSGRVRVYLGLGSNIEPERYLKQAVTRLREVFGAIAVSRVCRSPAVGFEGPSFCNLVVALDTDRDPDSLSELLRDIEDAAGRERGGGKFAPRTLDIDILTYGTLVRATRPAVPRADILEYAFVLGPLADLAAEERHPVLGRTYGELWKAFDGPPDGFEWMDKFWGPDVS